MTSTLARPLLTPFFYKYLPEKIRFGGSGSSSSPFQSLLSSLAILALALSLRNLRLSIGSRRVKWEKGGGGDFSTALRPLLPAGPSEPALKCQAPEGMQSFQFWFRISKYGTYGL